MILKYTYEDKFKNSELFLGVGYSDMSEPKNREYKRTPLVYTDFEKISHKKYANIKILTFGLSRSDWGILSHVIGFDGDEIIGFDPFTNGKFHITRDTMIITEEGNLEISFYE